MKTKVKDLDYEKVISLKEEKVLQPLKPGMFFRWLMKTAGALELKATNFKCNFLGMEKLGKKEPCLILMNHSCFEDLEIVSSVFYPRPVNIVCTSDGFVGKKWLMRHLGCIPTNKFVTDFKLIRHIKYALEKLKSSVLVYPEASYSFDGTATPFNDSMAKLIKLLSVPVVMIKTYGAFHHNPLYNNLQQRKVDVSADVKYLLSPEEIQNKNTREIDSILQKEFTFDAWEWQQKNHIKVNEDFRADSLNRVLYKCPCCGSEGHMLGRGIQLACSACGAKWNLSELGRMEQLAGKPVDEKFSHIPSWYKWEREEVKKEIKAGTYRIESDVEIYMMVNTKSIYHVGSGHLTHSEEGFILDGCNGKLHYEQNPKVSHSLYSDYNWYELGDMICIGNTKTLYYCFPKEAGDIVAKARIAAEEIYKLKA